MFAGFNFRIDSQENLINFSDYAIQGKNHDLVELGRLIVVEHYNALKLVQP